MSDWVLSKVRRQAEDARRWGRVSVEVDAVDLDDLLAEIDRLRGGRGLVVWEREWVRVGDGPWRRDPTTAALVVLRAVAQDWLNAMDFDGVECSCAEGDPCPRCRCVEALSISRLR